MTTTRRSTLWIVLALAVAVPGSAAGIAQPLEDGSPNFDARIDFNAGFVAAPSAGQLAAATLLRQELPQLVVDYDAATGVARSLSNRSGYLTRPRPTEDVQGLALQFVRANLELLGLSDVDVADHEVTDTVATAVTGATRIYLRQTAFGLPVYNGQLQINVNRDGRILSVHNAFLSDLGGSINTTTPGLDADQAIARAARHLGLDPRGEVSLEPVAPRLMWLPIRQGDARLVWNFQIHTLDQQHMFDFTVDAVSGQVWTRFDWVASEQQRVYRLGIESPQHTTPPPPADARTLEVDAYLDGFPGNALRSWHNTNGVPGAEFTITRGNNAHAYEDIDANNVPPAVEVDCGAPLSCDFPIDLTMAPSAFIPASVTNLFYWNNVIHDVQYQYGFDEASGNFQVDNFGLGGLGNDDVRAEAQDGGGNCNANFGTPPDGSRPRMQMYTCNIASPPRDGALDNHVVVHEYGHGISNRLVGGPGNVSCLNNQEQGGEGYSDWWGLVYTAQPTHVGTDARGVGTYLLGQPPNGPGVRPDPYSTDFAVNARTYDDIITQAVPHGVGFVWATIAWEAYWEVVNLRGFDSDLYTIGNAGDQRLMLYHNEGLKNAPCSPGFVDVRDGILQAATDNYDGEDLCFLWAGFARRGLGVSADQGSPFSKIDGTEAFDLPIECDPNGDGVLDVFFTSGFGSGNTGDWSGQFP